MDTPRINTLDISQRWCHYFLNSRENSKRDFEENFNKYYIFNMISP